MQTCPKPYVPPKPVRHGNMVPFDGNHRDASNRS